MIPSYTVTGDIFENEGVTRLELKGRIFEAHPENDVGFHGSRPRKRHLPLSFFEDNRREGERLWPSPPHVAFSR